MYCKHCGKPIEHVLNDLWNGFEGKVLRQYCFVDPMHGSRLHEPDYAREQQAKEPEKQPGDALREELEKVEAATPQALNELLYTAYENGMIYGMDTDQAMRIYRLVLLAQSYGSRSIGHLRM